MKRERKEDEEFTTEIVQSEAEIKLEQLKEDLIARYKKKKFELPYLVRAAGCTSSRDYLTGQIEETRQILWKYFNWKEEDEK